MPIYIYIPVPLFCWLETAHTIDGFIKQYVPINLLVRIALSTTTMFLLQECCFKILHNVLDTNPWTVNIYHLAESANW